MKDERIEQATNKIWSELAIIIYVGVALSFSVKVLVFNMGLQERITEYLILIFTPLYQFVRMHMMKISIYSERMNWQSLKNLIIAIAIFLIASVVSIFRKMKESAVYDWQRSAVFLFIFLVLFISLSFITNKFNQHRVHKYEKEFDNDK